MIAAISSSVFPSISKSVHPGWNQHPVCLIAAYRHPPLVSLEPRVTLGEPHCQHIVFVFICLTAVTIGHRRSSGLSFSLSFFLLFLSFSLLCFLCDPFLFSGNPSFFFSSFDSCGLCFLFRLGCIKFVNPLLRRDTST